MARKKVYAKVIIAVFLFTFCIIGISLFVIHIKAADSPKWSRFEKDMYAAMKYYYRSIFPSTDWIECDDLNELWRYLKKEKIEKISFCWAGYEDLSPEKWWTWGEIEEPNKIKLTLQLIYDGRTKWIIKIACNGRIKIITNKHKFFMPAEWDNKRVYSYWWKSRELRKQLWKWGFPDINGLDEEYNYSLPQKEETIAILLYPGKIGNPPLVLFGDKGLAEQFVFGDNFVNQIASDKLHELAAMRALGIKREKNNGETTFDKHFDAQKIIPGREWIDKIMYAYEISLKEIEKKEKYFPEDMDSFNNRILFITKERVYWKGISIDANSVYDDYIRSERLKAYFDELGITKELLEGHQKAEKTVPDSNS
jgi:hypothetical protein